MKKLFYSLFSILLLALAGCSDEEDGEQPVVVQDIDLGNQPLSVVKAHVLGEWTLLYTIGGGYGNAGIRKDFPDSFFTFKTNDSIYKRDNGITVVAGKIEWKHVMFSGPSFGYIMSVKPGLPIAFYIQEIKKGELILDEYASHGDTYYLIRK